MLQFSRHPWPYSELPADEADRILALPRQEREQAEKRLKADIKSGALARRLKYRAIDAANAGRE